MAIKKLVWERRSVSTLDEDPIVLFPLMLEEIILEKFGFLKSLE